MPLRHVITELTLSWDSVIYVSGTRRYDPGKRTFRLLANLVDRPRSRSELYELGYEQSGADQAKALNRDLERLRGLGYPVSVSDDDEPMFSLDREGLIGIDLDSADLTLLRLAAQSLTGKDELHQVARRAVRKLLGGASVTGDQATVRIAIPEYGDMFDIVEAMGERAPIVIEYENPQFPERRFYTVEVTGVWETMGAFYCRGNRLAVGPTRDEMVEMETEERVFRLSRIVSIDVLEPTGYEADTHLERIFEPVDASIYLKEGAGDHLRDEEHYVGSADGWDEYRFENVNLHRLLEQLAVVGTRGRTSVPDYRERLEHLVSLEDK